MLPHNTRVVRLILLNAEFLPLLAFVYLGRFETDLSGRFFWGAGTAIALVPILVIFRWRPNPLLIAVNIWLCIEAFAFLVFIPPLAQVLQALRESAFFVAIIVVGASYIALSKRGLLTVDHEDQKRVRGYSFALLALAAGGLVCSAAFRGNEMYAAALPAAALFLAQMLMNARLSGRSPGS